ncbi:gliding motility-associated C-terminal domain-containing protein [Flaviaesturariibacter terrae]
MRLFLLSLFCLCTAVSVQAQGFTFSCARDTTLRSCDPICINLQAKVPDLRASTATYNVAALSNTTGCFIPYVQPNDPAGQATSLTIDDKYSTVIDIGFTFPFYGTNYTQLIASTNGLVSFDISKATQFSHYAILRNGSSLSATSGTPQDLPSNLFDKALIMGPYHDINPATTTSPNRRIQYQVFGVAPYRRWILSFYKVPQFSCNTLIENTHQIVLYESTGIVEVFVFSRQPCTAWNQGRAMIGLQNMTRDQAIMAPGRKASDPVWGTVGMNESWRFVPASGGSLLKRVELYDMSGSLVGLGAIGTAANGAVSVEFPNVCNNNLGTTAYRMQAVYQKIDDASVEIFGNDTIRINRPGLPFSINVTSQAATCTTPSSITLTPQANAGVPPFTFAIAPFGNPAGVYQSGNVFLGVAPGLYNGFVKDATGCESSQAIFVTAGPAAIIGTATATPSGCTVGTGTVTTTWLSGGSGPYTYALDNGAFQATGNFTGVTSGTHTAIIKDANGCSTQITVNVGVNANPTATATSTASGCTVNNGSITVTALTGLAPYTYALDGSTTFQASNQFTAVGLGAHTVTVKDAGGCTVTLNVNVAQTANPSATATVTATGCAGPSGTATITATGGTAPYTYCLGATPASCQATSTLTGLAAGQQYLSVKDANGCVGIVDVTIPTSTPPTATAATTASGCVPSGTITVTATGGTAPYTYQMDAGTVQNGNVFSAVATGSHSIIVTDARGCTATITATVSGTPAPTATAASTPSGCNPASGTITVSTQTGTAPFTYALDGSTTFQASNVFNAVAAGAHSVQVKDNNGCTVTVNVTVASTPAVAATATATNALCTTNNGTLTVNVSAGTAPYQYTLSGTATAQAANTFTNLAPGSYTVAIRDAAGCTFTTTASTVGQTNDITITPLTTQLSGCAGTQASVNFTTNATSVSWTPTTGVSNPAGTSATITIGNATTYTVTAGTGTCTATATVTVAPTAPPTVDAGPSERIQLGDSVQLQASVSPAGTYSYSWSPGVTLRDSTVLQPWARPAVTTLYTLTVRTPQGCVGRDTMTVVLVGDCIDPHNAFTPNGDGINDNWRVTDGTCALNIHVQVFNRYGGKVYENRDYRNDWTGYYEGKLIPDGTYYYNIVYRMADGRVITRRGDVTIVR